MYENAVYRPPRNERFRRRFFFGRRKPSMLSSFDALYELRTAECASNAGAIVGFLADPDPDLRSVVLVFLSGLEQEVLASHASAIVRFLADPDQGVRSTALDVLCLLRDAWFTPHISDVVGMLGDPDLSVRNTALYALGKAEPTTLTSYTGDIMSFLTDPDPGVRWTALRALCKIGDTTLLAETAHVTDVVSMLRDPDRVVRAYASRTLFKFEQATLTAHAVTIAGLLTSPYPGPDYGVRHTVLGLFAWNDALGKLTPAVIAMARSAITNMLDDAASIDVRNQAKIALGNLKKKLVQFYWGTARAFVYVRPYALFWHEYAGTQLCAPGGKWATRDCAAFNAEFNENLRQ